MPFWIYIKILKLSLRLSLLTTTIVLIEGPLCLRLSRMGWSLQTTQFSETSVLNKAMSLSFAELLGNANDVNSEVENYQKVTAEGINRVANEILIKTNCSTLIYAKSK